MFKKTLMTAAAALAIMTGGSAISATDAEAGGKFKITFGHGNYGGNYGGHYGGYYGGNYGGHYGGNYGGGYGGNCYWKKHKVKKWVWHNNHKHYKWTWHSHKRCY